MICTHIHLVLHSNLNAIPRQPAGTSQPLLPPGIAFACFISNCLARIDMSYRALVT